MAYMATADSMPADYGVRLDFRWVLHLSFSSFYSSRPRGERDHTSIEKPFALNVTDDSVLRNDFLGGFSDPEWSRVFGEIAPSEVLRHFFVCFDDFGYYDILALEGTARTFPTSEKDRSPLRSNSTPADHAKEQARNEARMLRDAAILDPPPPIVGYPFE